MLTVMLFGHIVGAQVLFAALALEWVILRQSDRSRPLDETSSWLRVAARLYRAAGGLLLITGMYMAATLGLWEFGWVRVAMLALILIVAVSLIGASVRRLRFSLAARTAATLAVVYVMVAKTGAVESLLIVTTAALAGIAVAVSWLRGTPGLTNEAR